MELSVVIACLDGAATLGEQLDALVAQETPEPWEVVVSDNGSRDGSHELVREYAARFEHVRLVDSSDRSGLAHARNAGARAAAGRSVAFCDQDDRVAPGWLAAMVEALRRHELVAGRLEHDLLNEPWAIEVRGRPQTEHLLEYEPGWPPFAFGCTLGVRMQLHQRLGGFDERFEKGAEDTDYCWRAQRAGANLVFVPEAVTHYRCRHNLGGVFRQARDYGESEVHVYAKHRTLGLPPARRPLRRGVRRWLATGRAFARARSRRELALALWMLGLGIGHALGSLEDRTPLL